MEAGLTSPTSSSARGDDLRRAISTGEFTVFFQPKICCDLGTVSSLEALARWNHPELGLLGPLHFLQDVELHGLTTTFTDRIVDQTLSQLEAWDRQGFHPNVSVNLATADLIDHDLALRINRALSDHSVDPSRLTFEISENLTLRECDEVHRRLVAVRAAGVRLSLDDFGAGLTSFAHLGRLPIDELKVDRSIVSQINTEKGATVAKAVVQLGVELGLGVVGEGASTLADVEKLRSYGCHEIQGYYYTPPIPHQEVIGWVSRFASGSPTASS